MKVLVTGAAGFVGGALVETLAAGDEIETVWAHDRLAPAADRKTIPVAGEIDFIGSAMPPGAAPDLVYHVAGITTAACEADPDAGFRVNVEGTRALLAWCRGLPHPPRLVLTSSVAVFGGGEAVVHEASRPAPASTYGGTKLIAETLVADATRRGEVEGVVLRLPVTMVRPDRTGRAGAGYLSDMVRAALAGTPLVAPLAADHVVPVATIAATLRMLLALAEAREPPGLVHVPAYPATGRELIAILTSRGLAPRPGQFAFAPDPAVERLIAGWPARFESREAAGLGLGRAETLAEIVDAATTASRPARTASGRP